MLRLRLKSLIDRQIRQIYLKSYGEHVEDKGPMLANAALFLPSAFLNVLAGPGQMVTKPASYDQENRFYQLAIIS